MVRLMVRLMVSSDGLFLSADVYNARLFTLYDSYLNAREGQHFDGNEKRYMEWLESITASPEMIYGIEWDDYFVEKRKEEKKEREKKREGERVEGRRGRRDYLWFPPVESTISSVFTFNSSHDNVSMEYQIVVPYRVDGADGADNVGSVSCDELLCDERVEIRDIRRCIDEYLDDTK